MNEQQSFLDPKTLLAIFLLGTVWIGWQFHLQDKYPDAYKEKTEVIDTTTGSSVKKGDAQVTKEVSGELEATSAKLKEGTPETTVLPVNLPEKFISFEDDKWSFLISSRGMGIKDIHLKTYKDRENRPKLIGAAEDELAFSTRLSGQRKLINFVIKKTGEKQFVGKAKIGSTEIVKTVTVDSNSYTLDTKIFVTGADENFLGVETLVADLVKEATSGSSFLPAFERQEFFVAHDGEEDRIHVTPDESVSESFDKVKLLGLSTQYFSLAILDKSDVMPEVKTRVGQDNKMIAALTHNIISRSAEFNVHYVGFAGPKSLQLLSSIDEEMASLVDFGMFSVIGRVILKVMKGFYSVVGNWGFAIILLTILVRLIVLPFNVMSYKSMKGMQKIQPELKRIREKYKDDKMKLNQETMALMKTANANPLGGCLPMLLQFPIFIALYQVIGQSIELYQAPFALWVGDLSLKDPYYVLPVLMSITIFLQQKMTPTQMDPAQQKVMMLMPLMFMVFMISLPSGLTLYMFVSALFAVGQQAFFMRNTDKVVAA